MKTRDDYRIVQHTNMDGTSYYTVEKHSWFWGWCTRGDWMGSFIYKDIQEAKDRIDRLVGSQIVSIKVVK